LLLVLDDYHTITLEEIQYAIASLVEHCPPNLHLVMATRADPRLPLSRLRVRGQLCALRAVDLQFDSAEARAFLHTALQRELEASTLATILSQTEGWIAGLQLTALLVAEAQLAGAIAQSPSPPFPGAGSGCPGPLVARPGTGGGRDTLA
jgi:LuxR family maltose regulon positive regulatory protein